MAISRQVAAETITNPMRTVLDPMDVTINPDSTSTRIREHVRENPDLIYDDYDSPPDSLQGACYVLSEAYFHAQGGTDSGLDIYCLSWSDVDPDATGTHWYLRDSNTDTWIDLGLDRIEQAEHVPFPEGTRRAFITGYKPSKRARSVLDGLDL